MNHSFCIEHAQAYGIAEAVLIQNFQFWIAKNKANGMHYYEDRTWTYNSVKAFSELFPYMTVNQVRRSLEHLVAAGVLLEGNYSAKATDRTKWYAFDDESIWLAPQVHLANLPNAVGSKAKPFGKSAKSTNTTDVNADSKPDGGRASRLAADWLLPKAWGEWAQAEYPLWTADHIRRVALMFKNHWIAKSGRDAAKLDWYATWQNWCMKEPAAPKGAAGAGSAPWWSSDPLIEAKGKEYGLRAQPGENMRTFQGRVQAAMDGGGTVPAAPQPAQAPLPIPLPESVASAVRKDKPANVPRLSSLVGPAPVLRDDSGEGV